MSLKIPFLQKISVEVERVEGPEHALREQSEGSEHAREEPVLVILKQTQAKI